MTTNGLQGNHQEAATAAQNRANMYSFLATLLNERPDAALVGNLKTAGGGFIRALAEEASLTGPVAEGFRDMAKYVEDHKSQPEAEVQQDLAVDWTRLFRGLSPAYSPMPPYEASFMVAPGNEFELIQKVNETYRANGVELSADCKERPDYMGLELSFLEHLAEAEAQAWEEDNLELAKSHQRTAWAFLNEHLGAWADQFIEPATSFAKTSFYHGVLKLCRGVVAEAAA